MADDAPTLTVTSPGGNTQTVLGDSEERVDANLTDVPLDVESQKASPARSTSIKLGLAIAFVSIVAMLVVGTVLLGQHFMGAVDFGGRGSISKTADGNLAIAYTMTNPAGRARAFRAHARLLCDKDVLDGDVVVSGTIPAGKTTHAGVHTYTAVTPAILQCLDKGQLELMYDHQDLNPA